MPHLRRAWRHPSAEPGSVFGSGRRLSGSGNPRSTNGANECRSGADCLTGRNKTLEPNYTNHSATVAILLELLHDPLEVPSTGCGVDRRRLEPLMSQKRRYAHQVGSCIERVLAEAMAEGMWRDVLEAGQAPVLGDQ